MQNIRQTRFPKNTNVLFEKYIGNCNRIAIKSMLSLYWLLVAPQGGADLSFYLTVVNKNYYSLPLPRGIST